MILASTPLGRERRFVSRDGRPRRAARVWRAVALLALGGGLAGGPARAQTPPAPERDLNQPLVMAVSEAFFPYSFRDTDGVIRGFATDLTEAVARVANLKLRPVIVSNRDMVGTFQRGEVDFAQFWAETPERRAFAEFSVPIARAETIVVTRRDDSRIRRLRDLDGKRVAVGVTGNVAWRYLVDRHPTATPVFTENSERFLRMLSAGEIDAAVMSRLTAETMIDRFGLGNLQVLQDRIVGDDYDVRYCFAVRKGDALLLARLNEALAILHRTGEFDLIYRKWFGRYEPRTFSPFEVVSYVAAALALACIAVTWGFLRQRTLSHRISRQAAELAEQRSLLAALHEKHPLATLILELPATGVPLLVSANAEAIRLFALDPKSLLPAPLDAPTFSADLRTHLAETVKHWRDAGQPRQWEARLPATQQLLEAALMPLGHDENGTQRLCVVANDVTRRRLMDQEIAQSRRLRALGELVGGIAHEFNNLLTPIIMTTSHARHDTTLPLSVQSDFAVIEGAARRAAELTRRLLTFGRKSDETVRSVQLADAVENCFALLRPTVDRRVEWIFRPTPDVPPVLFNPTDLNQIVFNLVINARDTLLEKLAGSAAPDWIPRLTVWITPLPISARAFPAISRPADRVLTGWQRLTVADNGIGIPPEIIDRIFEPFFTTKEVGQGTGLGLATVWHLATEAGGEVSVQSKLGQGTHFHVTLPQWQVRPADEPDAAPPTAAATASTACRVLLVEDELLVARAATAVLERHGHHVMHRLDGAEAWSHLAGAVGAYDVLLLDVNMPRMNGVDLIRRVRQTSYSGAIIVMSGRLTESERRALDELRVDRVIGKPFTVAELDEALQAVRHHRPLMARV